ncbi:MAG: nickel pincer cofactor biosynthesis protein LarB [Candidatus Bathyarchaeia archaeon]
MRDILERLVKGEITLEEAEGLLRGSSISEITELAKLDVNREVRKGFPEIILAEGKHPEDVAKISRRMLDSKGRVMISRINEEHLKALRDSLGSDIRLELNEKARMVTLKTKDFEFSRNKGKIGVITAGTSDIPIAEEVKVVAEEMGCTVYSAYDAGVAGLHRLFPPLKEMLERDVDVLVVVAGREGALPTVVSGLVDIPIIAVPTSIGYGHGGSGVSALMSMLQACSLGIAVVNIDAGVAAGTISALIARRSHDL